MKKKNINLGYLNKISDNNSEIIKEMIEIYISGISETLEKIKTAMNDRNLEALRQTAHKGKSSVLILGLNELSAYFGEVEEIIVKNSNIDRLPFLVDKIIACLEDSNIEAQELILTL